MAHDIVQNRFDRKNSLGYPIFPQNSHLSNSLSISSNVSKKEGKSQKSEWSKFLSASNSSYTTLSDQDFLTFLGSRATLAGLLLIPCFYIKMMVFFLCNKYIYTNKHRLVLLRKSRMYKQQCMTHKHREVKVSAIYSLSTRKEHFQKAECDIRIWCPTLWRFTAEKPFKFLWREEWLQNGETFVCLILVRHIKYLLCVMYDQFYKDIYCQFIKQFLLVLNKINSAFKISNSLIMLNYWCIF